MEWLVLLLVVLPLGVWVWGQNQRIDALVRRVAELERRLAEAAKPPVAAKPSAAEAPAATRAGEPFVLDTPLPSDEREPLLLDTPVPEASNDAEAPTPEREEPVLLLTEVVPPEAEPAVPFPPAAATPPPRVRRPRARKFEQWLAENGLAWLGGGALALGGIFLASFAARQVWFTPQVQLASAVAFGLAVIGASEWARRAARQRPPGHPLVAALLAGAGVVILYAAAWAAHGLYGLVDWAAAAAMLTLCAAILVGLSFLHGQALGVLAIGVALLAPAVASSQLWPWPVLTAYVSGVGAAGFGVAALQRWTWSAAAALVGLYFWFAAAIAADDVRVALALASVAAAGGVALAYRKPLQHEPPGRLTWTRAHAYLPAIAISVSSALLIWAWASIAPLPTGIVAGPAWVGAVFVGLAAAAVRARAAPPAALAVSIGALVFGFVVYLRARFYAPSLGADFYPFILFAAGVVVLSAIGARPHRNERVLIAAAGAGGAGLLVAMAALSRSNWHGVAAWIPLFTGAGVLFGGAWFAAREAQDPRSDRAVGVWTAVAAALVLLGVESAFPAAARTATHAGAAALFAAGFVWRGWGALQYAALGAAVLAIGHALSPALIGAALAGTIPLGGALTILATSAALTFGASMLAARAAPRAWASEALGAAGVIVVLIGLFTALRWTAAGGAGATLDPFSETSLRALTLIAAGHVVMPRRGQETGRIGAWRGHVLIGLGLGYVLILPTTAINPWWGDAPARVYGPPILDTLTLAFLAPAALVFTAANRLYPRQRAAARTYAAAGGALALLWVLLALRRAFHGAAMAQGGVGPFEAACYALVFLGAALAIAIAARTRAAKDAERPLTQDLQLITPGAGWFGIVAAAYVLLAARHPWWGAQDPAASNALSTLLAVSAQALALGLALALGRALSRSSQVDATRFGAAALAALLGWSYGHAAIRWLYHRGYMDDGAALIGVEGFAHALWPLAYVVGAAALTARAPHRDNVRPYLYDLQAIWAAAIWPALSFAALGLWLLFNPWWGVNPAVLESLSAAIAALGALAFAAWLSSIAPATPHLRWPDWFARAATISLTGHLLIAATLAVRWLHHPGDMSTAAVLDAEAWVYSAVWALFGAGVFWFGMRRGDVLWRWIGLAILVATTIYVFVAALTRLTGVARIGSMIGLAAVLLVVAWLARRYRLGAPPGPGDLLPIKPSARRERRHGRRQRSP